AGEGARRRAPSRGARLAHWKRQRERRARVRARADVDRPAVRLGDRARDKEAEAGARLRPTGDVRAAELLEDEPLLVVRYTRPMVGDGDPHLAVLLLCAYLDLVAGRRVFDRVLEQVREHLPKAFAVAPDRSERR